MDVRSLVKVFKLMGYIALGFAFVLCMGLIILIYELETWLR